MELKRLIAANLLVDVLLGNVFLSVRELHCKHLHVIHIRSYKFGPEYCGLNPGSYTKSEGSKRTKHAKVLESDQISFYLRNSLRFA